MMKNIIFFSVLLCLFVAGCSQQYPDGFPKLYPVSIRVLQEGKPLENAGVFLKAVDSDASWSIGGRTNEKGDVELWTHGKYKGAPEGRFKVALSKIVNEGEDVYLDALRRGDSVAANRAVVKSFSLVELQYESGETTPVEIEITPKTRSVDVDAGPPVRIERPYIK